MEPSFIAANEEIFPASFEINSRLFSLIFLELHHHTHIANNNIYLKSDVKTILVQVFFLVLSRAGLHKNNTK